MSTPGQPNTCAVCTNPATFSGYDGRGFQVSCARCGSYHISRRVGQQLRADPPSIAVRTRISSWLAEQENPDLTIDLLPALEALPALAIGEKGKRLLLHLARGGTNPSRVISFPYNDLSLHAAAWAEDEDELVYILESYLEQQEHAIGPISYYSERVGGDIQISPRGWQLVEEYRSANPRSEDGFIAMAFGNAMLPTRAAIMAGIEGARFRPVVIDREEFTGKIDDEILSKIRQSRFVVADFTGQRQNVYYEAGFAEGLGIRVIWVIKKAELDDLHFDVRQFNFIDWDDDRLDELTERVTNRIGRVIGRGPTSVP